MLCTNVCYENNVQYYIWIDFSSPLSVIFNIPTHVDNIDNKIDKNITFAIGELSITILSYLINLLQLMVHMKSMLIIQITFNNVLLFSYLSTFLMEVSV